MRIRSARHALIICNGEMPSQRLIAPVLRTRPYIVCADGGANKARPFGITPHLIIGDLDSITQKTRRYYAGIPVVHDQNQNNTDLEKALDHLLQEGITSAVIIGATGERPDHTLANFSILLKYHRRLSLRFLDERCTAEVIHRTVRVQTEPGQPISLIPFGRCTGITTTGLRYPLRNEALEPGVREGSSNEATGTTVTVSVKKGPLMLFVIHPELGR